jgi:opacity protein-like surface antigen
MQTCRWGASLGLALLTSHPAFAQSAAEDAASGKSVEAPKLGEGTPGGFRPKLDSDVLSARGKRTRIYEKNPDVEIRIRGNIDLYNTLVERYQCKRSEIIETIDGIARDVNKIRDNNKMAREDFGLANNRKRVLDQTIVPDETLSDLDYKLSVMRGAYEHLPSCSDPAASRGQETISSWFGDTRTGPYIELNAGAAFQGGTSPAETGGIGLAHETGYSIGGAVGYDFGKFRAEAEVDYKRFRTTQFQLASPVVIPGLQDYPDRPGTPGIYLAPGQTPIATGHTSVVSFMANGLYDIVDTKGLNISVGGGIGFERVNLSLESYRIPRTTDSSSDTKFVWQVLAGVSVPINDHVDVGLKYRFMNGAKPALFKTANDPLYVNVSQHSIGVSLAYQFGPPKPPPPQTSETAPGPESPVAPPPDQGQPTAPVM